MATTRKSFLLLLVLAAVGCAPRGDAAGVESAPAPSPDAPQRAPRVEASCEDFEAQVDRCRETCDACEVSTPGNSCNVCAETCAEQIFCEQCGAQEFCLAADPGE